MRNFGAACGALAPNRSPVPAQLLAAMPPYRCGVPPAGKRVRFGEEEQGSGARDGRQAAPSQRGLCDDDVGAACGRPLARRARPYNS